MTEPTYVLRLVCIDPNRKGSPLAASIVNQWDVNEFTMPFHHATIIDKQVTKTLQAVAEYRDGRWIPKSVLEKDTSQAPDGSNKT